MHDVTAYDVARYLTDTAQIHHLIAKGNTKNSYVVVPIAQLSDVASRGLTPVAVHQFGKTQATAWTQWLRDERASKTAK